MICLRHCNCYNQYIELKHTDIEIIGTAKSVVEAAKILRNITPDILFLDIMLGEETGFDLLEITPDLKSKIIFVTASDEYAIKAFDKLAVCQRVYQVRWWIYYFKKWI